MKFLIVSIITIQNPTSCWFYHELIFNSFADTKEGRYNPKMDPVINVNHWRKGSQVKLLPKKTSPLGVGIESLYVYDGNLNSCLNNPCVTFITCFQWVVLTRKHAEIIVKDEVVFPMFQQHCQASDTIRILCQLLQHWYYKTCIWISFDHQPLCWLGMQ